MYTKYLTYVETWRQGLPCDADVPESVILIRQTAYVGNTSRACIVGSSKVKSCARCNLFVV